MNTAATRSTRVNMGETRRERAGLHEAIAAFVWRTRQAPYRSTVRQIAKKSQLMPTEKRRGRHRATAAEAATKLQEKHSRCREGSRPGRPGFAWTPRWRT